MSDFFTTEDDYDRLVEKVGPSRAAEIARNEGWQVRPKEVNFTPAMGGGDQMEDEDLNVATEDAADQDAAGSEGQYAGGLDAINLSNPQDISEAILKNARAQKQYYDQLAEQIKNRRYGPSESEKLFALSAALAAPTRVRGFSGVMANVMPVLQKFGELRRTGEEERTQALQELAKQRMQLAQGDVKTALDLQRLMAAYNKKPKGSQSRAVSNPQGRTVHSRYGTNIIPPDEEDLFNGRAFMNNPDVTEERKKQFRREWNKNYGVGADEIYLDDVAGGDE